MITFIVESQEKKKQKTTWSIHLQLQKVKDIYNIMGTHHGKNNTSEHNIIWIQTDNIGRSREIIIIGDIYRSLENATNDNGLR